MDGTRHGTGSTRGRRSAPAPMAAPDPGRRLRRVRAPALPDASTELVLRAHTASALVVELGAVAVVLFVGLDALRHGNWPVGTLAIVVGLVAAAAAVVAYRRTTRTSPEGLAITGLRTRFLAWADVDGFELSPHRTGRRDQVVARVQGDLVPFPHPDARSLALRPQLARSWYLSLIERIEARRPSGR